MTETRLPHDITFFHSEELEEKYPDLDFKERETTAVKEHGAIFVIGIGHPLPKSGKPHDGRAPDYDDWYTPNGVNGYRGLNGDILVWHKEINARLELSSMGVRVNAETLQKQSELQEVWDKIKD